MTYDQVYCWDNLWLAWRKAARGKRGRPVEELAARTYRPGTYASFYIHELSA